MVEIVDLMPTAIELFGAYSMYLLARYVTLRYVTLLRHRRPSVFSILLVCTESISFLVYHLICFGGRKEEKRVYRLPN